MNDIKTIRRSWFVFIILICINQSNSSFLDYFPSIGKSLFGWEEKSKEISLRKVPYEIIDTDEKFIEQAAQFTGVALSDLDKCQHRVVYKLQTECHKLNDEDLAKLAVKLLNCQSEIEGRTVYPCTEQMPIRDCTSSMDPDTWNSYLLMSNRARAVCYSIRQAQFRGLTEMTVNKLMNTAHEQINIMTRLKDGQYKIEQATQETYENVIKGNDVLSKQQEDLRQAQFFGQLALEDNIRRLADEKQLIIEGHENLIKMTEEVKTRLAHASKQLDTQAEEREDNHKEILNDLIEIQKQAQLIFSRIEESSRHMLEQSALAAVQYKATLAQLAQVNSTVYNLVDMVINTQVTLEENMKWLTEALGGTDDSVERLYLFVAHISYLILAMVSCAFLQVPIPGRIALVILVPLNLFIALQQGVQSSLSFVGLSIVLLSFIIIQIAFNYALYYWHKKTEKKKELRYETNGLTSNNYSEKTTNEEQKADSENYSLNQSSFIDSNLPESLMFRKSYMYKRFDLDTPDNKSENGDIDEFTHPTPPLSRLSRSRSKTPNTFSTSERPKCNAMTRMGTPCKSMSLLGRDYCYRHQTGSSVVVE